MGFFFRSPLGLGLALALLLAGQVGGAYAQADSPPADQEVVPFGETEATRIVVNLIEKAINGAYAKGERPALRDAHAKGHGCVKATFNVLPDIPRELAQGVLARPHSYTAWIRFSNGNGRPQNDQVADARGMAIKLTGVDGPKLLAGEADAKTQDFVMINYPVFFVRNAVDYVEFALSNKVFFLTRSHEARIAKAATTQTVDAAFGQRYFSMTPYRLGERYIKFSASPVDCASRAALAKTAAPIPDDPNYLRDGMADWLNAKDACFTFAVQPQTDPATMPIEDPTILWDEAKAPFVDVASIHIPKQRFDSETQQAFCENLSFTPWHALAAHRPVGGINRVRKSVYEAISTLRHRLNDAPRAEPTGNESFD